jgi:hypothetical protein
MRILNGLQSLWPASATPAAAPTPKGPIGKATALSFVDTAQIAVEAQERKAPAPATMKAKILNVFRPARKHEEILFDVHRIGTHGRLATFQAVGRHTASEVATVAAGAVHVRIIPAKAVDFGFQAAAQPKAKR